MPAIAVSHRELHHALGHDPVARARPAKRAKPAGDEAGFGGHLRSGDGGLIHHRTIWFLALSALVRDSLLFTLREVLPASTDGLLDLVLRCASLFRSSYRTRNPGRRLR